MTVKKSIFIALVFGACSAKQKAPAVDVEVSGMVSLTSSYCGGARPTEEVLEEYNRPKPYVGKILYFRKGVTNDLGKKIVGQVTVNDSGYFSLRLPPGSYAIVQEEQLKALDIGALTEPNTIHADTACLQKWWKQPLKVLEVKEGTTASVELNFHKACFISKDIPCLSYDGPMPP